MRDRERMAVECVGDVVIARLRDRWPREEEVSAVREEFRGLLARPECRHVLASEDRVRSLYVWLDSLYRSRRFRIPADTFRYWTEAAEGTPFHA